MNPIIIILFIIYSSYGYSDEFEVWYKKHSKFLTMNGISKKESSEAYIENMKYVIRFNSMKRSYNLSMTGPYAGISRERFKQMFNHHYNRTNFQLKYGYNPNRIRFNLKDYEPIDYRDQMSRVRDQGSCASCYSSIYIHSSFQCTY